MRDLDSAPAGAGNAHSASSENRRVAASSVAQPEKIPPRVYGVMALTTTLTFATLMTGYQALFTHHLYA